MTRSDLDTDYFVMKLIVVDLRFLLINRSIEMSQGGEGGRRGSIVSSVSVPYSVSGSLSQVIMQYITL